MAKKTSRPKKVAGVSTEDGLNSSLNHISPGVDTNRPTVTSITYRDVDALLQGDRSRLDTSSGEHVAASLAAAQVQKELRMARQLLASDTFKLAYNNLRHGALVHTYGLGLSATDTILGLPGVGREASLIKMRAAASRLAGAADGTSVDKEVQLPGRQSFAVTLSDVDYQRAQRTVNLPIGNLASLQTYQRDKLTTYLRLVLQRMASMSSITDADEEEVIGGILNVMHRDWSRITDDLKSLGIDIGPEAFSEDSREAIRSLIDQLRDIDEMARKRFISLTVLQPLYRDVLISRSEFSWPTIEDVTRMARSHAGWKRMKAEGVMANFIQGDISRVVAADTQVAGFATLREATFLGVRHNAFIGISNLTEAIGVDAGYVHNVSDDGNRIEFGDRSVVIDRSVSQLDVLGQPIILTDRVNIDAIESMTTREEVITAVRALASLSNVDIIENVSLDFVTTYPEWSGIVSPDLPSNVGISAQGLALPKWVRERLVHDFICAVLNGEFADTSISGLFAEQNNADLQKVFEAGAYYYGVALTVVQRLLRQYIAAARESYEWANSPVWAELASMGVAIDEPLAQAFKTSYISTLTHGPIAVGRGSSGVSATRYYVDEEALSLTPATARLMGTLRSLQCYGNMSTEVRRSRPFLAPAPAPVDISEILLSQTITRTAKREILATSDQMSAADINSLVMTSRRDFTATIYDKVTTSEGFLAEGFAFVGKVQPTIEIFYDHINRVDQLPVSFISGDDAVDGPVISADLSNILARSLRLVDPTVAIRIDTEVFDLSDVGVQVMLPTSNDELRLAVHRWQSGSTVVFPAAETVE